MRKTLAAMALILLLGSCAATRKNVYWEIMDAYTFDDRGNKLHDIPTGTPVTIYVEVERRKGPSDGPGSPERGQRTKGKVIPLTFEEEGRTFKGGLDVLKFDITLGRNGKGYIHDVIIEYDPLPTNAIPL